MTYGLPVQIDGVDYAVDPSKVQFASIEKVRQQADSSLEFGEATLNPLDLWRRSQDDWSAGSGQIFLDKREDASRRRFWENDRTDGWDRGELKLTTSANYYADLVSVIGMAVANGKVCYLTQDGANYKLFGLSGAQIDTTGGVFPAADLYPSASLFPGAPANNFALIATGTAKTAVDLCSDGFHVYVLHTTGADQVNVTSGAITAATTQTGTFIGFAKGRLIIGNGAALYDASAAAGGAATAITPSTIRSNWQWVSVTESGDRIFIAGFGGERNDIYSITVTEDAAALTIPVPAAYLPYGERIHCIYGYADAMMIGTSQGFHIAQEADGKLYYGPLIEPGGSVTTLTAWGRNVFFGGVTSANLGFIGRMDLGLFTADLVPAWSLDLFTPTVSRALQGAETETLRDMVILDGRKFWLVENHLWYETAGEYSGSGSLTSSSITYDMPDQKVFAFIRVHCDPLIAGESVDVEVQIDGGAWIDIGTISGVGETGSEFHLTDDHLMGGDLRYRLTLNRSSTITSSPVVQMVTVKALPTATGGDQIILPLLLHEDVMTLQGAQGPVSPMASYLSLAGLAHSGELVPVTLFGEEFEAVVDGVQWGEELAFTNDQQSLQGTCTVVLRSFPH